MKLLLESGDFLTTEDDRYLLTEHPVEEDPHGGTYVLIARRTPVTVSVQ